MPICSKCKQEKEDYEYWRIVRRRTYEDYSDDNGYVEVKKPTKMCIDCRRIALEAAKRFSDKKRNQ